MIELLFQLGFALMCGCGAAAAMLWAILILPDWLRRRRAAVLARQNVNSDHPQNVK